MSAARVPAVALVALLLAPLLPAGGASAQETSLDVRAWHLRVGGPKPDLTDPQVVIEVVDVTSGARYATDDPGTARFICRSGDATDVCEPPGGDVFDPNEKNRALVAFQPGDWSVGDDVQVTIQIPGNATKGVTTSLLVEGGLAMDVVLITPPDSVSLTVFPSMRRLAPDAAGVYQVRVSNDRPFEETIDLARLQTPHAGWTATLAETSATLPPGGTFATTLTIDSPAIEQTPYAGGTHNPARYFTFLKATPRGAPQLAVTRLVIADVPLDVAIELDGATPLLVLDACRAVTRSAPRCYPDPMQQVGLDVVLTWADGTPAAGATAEVVFTYAGLALGSRETHRAQVVADEEGRARVLMPYNGPALLPGLNLPGTYTVTAHASLNDLQGRAATTFLVGPVT